MKKFTFILIGIALFLGGFFVRPYASSHLSKTIRFTNLPRTSTTNEYACKSVADASVGQSFDKSVLASAGAGTDDLSLKIDSSTRKVKLLTAAGVTAGATEGEDHEIIEETSEYVVAIGKLGVLGPNYSVLVFNKEDSQGVWTKAADALFRSASSFYLNCY